MNSYSALPGKLRPKQRSRLRLKAGRLWYTGRRTFWWVFGRHHFARIRTEIDLPCEQFRHSYDVFPDSNRTQPFGSGATCVYNYRDLMIRNNILRPFQLRVAVMGNNLQGS